MTTISTSKQRFFKKAAEITAYMDDQARWLPRQKLRMVERALSGYNGYKDDFYAEAKAKLLIMSIIVGDTMAEATAFANKGLLTNSDNTAKNIVLALNDDPKDWVDDALFFERKGLLKGIIKYYNFSNFKELDAIRSLKNNIPEQYNGIFMRCVDSTNGSKGDTGFRIAPELLLYVAAYLQPDEKAKDSVLQKVLERVGKSQFERSNTRALEIIEYVSDNWNIDIDGLNLPVIAVAEDEAANEAANDPAKTALSLEFQIKCLVSRGSIEPNEGSTYLWLNEKIEKGEKVSSIAIQSKLLKNNYRPTFEAAAGLQSKVENHLAELQKDMERNKMTYPMYR